MRRSFTAVLLGMAFIAIQAEAQNPKSGKEPAQTSPSASGESTPIASPNAPHTEMMNSVPKSADPLLDVPPLPNEGVTLVGGSVRKVDRVRNRILLQPFGGGNSMWMRFDERTHIFRDGRETTILGVKPGDRAYADTQTVDSFVFARNVRVHSTSAKAQALGQILNVNAQSNTVTMTDSMTGQTVSFLVTPHTVVKSNTGTTDYLRPGTVVSVAFAPSGESGEATEIQVLAVPGMKFTFAGRITYVDLSSGTIAVDNDSDGKNYSLNLRMLPGPNRDSLRVGSTIAASATFDGRQYLVQDFSITSQPVASEQ